MYAGKTELSLFDHAMPQVVVESSTFEEIYPKDSISGYAGQQIEFNIMGSDNDYLDLNDTLLIVKLKTVKHDGTDFPSSDATDMIPSNYLLHTLFKEASLSLNNVKVEDTNDTYMQKAIIEAALNFGSDTKNTFLESIGYHKDDEKRKGWIKKSAKLTLCGALNLDFFDQPKYLLPGVNVTIKLTRNVGSVIYKYTKGTDAVEMNPQPYIIEAKLLVRRVRVDQAVMIGHQQGLEHQNAIYPFQKTKIVHFTIPKNSHGEYKDNLFSDERLPKFVLIAFQSSKQASGDYGSFCSTFSNYGVKSISLARNVDYRETYTTDFENDFTEAYVQSIIRNMGLLNADRNNGITMKEFKDSYTFFTFVLAPDFAIDQAQIPKTGNLKLDVRFHKALTESVTMYAYGVFDSEIQISKKGVVFV